MKMRPPSFWHQPPSLATTLLTPLAGAVRLQGQRRLKKPASHVAVPVLCCGNITVGGTGKTPLTLHLARHLQANGYNPHILTKGYGGRSKQQRLILPSDDPIDCGDETILLARQAPTWRGKNRVDSAQSAIAHGADCLILDDGLQDPSLYKDVSVLVIDGPAGLGNGLILPAGPLRETLDSALSRIQAAVMIGKDRHHLSKHFPSHIPLFKAEFSPGPEIRDLVGKQCIAFSGIGRPEKFFTMLKEMGVTVIRTLSFPDHHLYTQRDLHRLSQLASLPGVTLVTTEKDAVKLPQEFIKNIKIITVDLLWHDDTSASCIIDQLFPKTL